MKCFLNSNFSIFEKYALSFIPGAIIKPEDALIKENIELKINHTLRVSKLALSIAGKEWNSPDKTQTAVLCALYHDIGRFKQFSEFMTYLDSKSINHAEAGAEILKDGDFLSSFSTKKKHIIIECTRTHNMQNIPCGINHDTAEFLKLTRDADKIDILEIFCSYHRDRNENPNMALELDLPDSEGFSTEITDLIFQGKTVSNSLRKNYNDMKLIHLAWILDLNYRESFRIISERKTIERLSSFLPDHETVHKVIRRIKRHCAERE